MTERIGNGDGGAIVITKNGDIGHAHNSRKMTWAWVRRSRVHFGVQAGEEWEEDLDLSS